jgi:hypothetical protein
VAADSRFAAYAAPGGDVRVYGGGAPVKSHGWIDAQLHDGLLTWVTGTRVHSYDVRTHARASWRFAGRWVDVAHTRSRIFASIADRRIVAVRRHL